MLTVQDNSTHDICKAVQTDLMKLRTFRMEFSIGIVSYPLVIAFLSMLNKSDLMNVVLNKSDCFK